MLTPLEFKQIKAALDGMADFHKKEQYKSNEFWVMKDSVLKLIETFADLPPKEPKPKKEPKTKTKPIVTKPPFSRKSQVQK
ncbi:hypothetical protein N9948_01790 [bacterium]|nr:hypothetical protein [bacterium]